MIAPQPVLAEWVPLHGHLRRMPTAVSWRQRSPGGIYDLVLLTVNGMEILHTVDPRANHLEYLNTSEMTHWLEGHPEESRP